MTATLPSSAHHEAAHRILAAREVLLRHADHLAAYMAQVQAQRDLVLRAAEAAAEPFRRIQRVHDEAMRRHADTLRALQRQAAGAVLPFVRKAKRSRVRAVPPRLPTEPTGGALDDPAFARRMRRTLGGD